MHIGRARHMKICEDLGKMKNDDSRGLRRVYKGRNHVPKFQDILHISKHLKRQRNKQTISVLSTLTCTQTHIWGRQVMAKLDKCTKSFTK